jgi:capsid protein
VAAARRCSPAPSPASRSTEYALDPAKFEAARFKPRGWSWVDPTKEVAAAKEAVKAGFTTRADVIAATADGRDIEDIDRQRVRELEDEKAAGSSTTPRPRSTSPPRPARRKAPARRRRRKSQGERRRCRRRRAQQVHQERPPLRAVSLSER